MGDIITFLEFLLKLERGKLIPTEQIDQLADILEDTLRKNLSKGVYDSLNELLEEQLNSNEQNSLFLDILKSSQEKDTLTKLTEYLDKVLVEYLDKISSNELDFKYELDFKVPSRDREYMEIYKDPNQGYILKYTSTYSKHIYTTPIKDLYYKDLTAIWDAIQEMNANI